MLVVHTTRRARDGSRMIHGLDRLTSFVTKTTSTRLTRRQSLSEKLSTRYASADGTLSESRLVKINRTRLAYLVKHYRTTTWPFESSKVSNLIVSLILRSRSFGQD